MKKYKLSKEIQEQLKEQNERKEGLKKVENDLLQTMRDLRRAREENHVPDINRLEEEKTILERKVKEETWFLKQTKPIVPQLINDQFDAEVRPDYDLAIKEAGEKAKEAAQPFFDALAEFVRLRQEIYSIARDWNKHINDPIGSIEEGQNYPGGLVAHYNGCRRWAQEYIQDKPHLRSWGELMQEQANAWEKKKAAEHEEERRQEYCINLARRYSGLPPEQALDKAMSRGWSAVNNAQLKTGHKAFDKKRFLADLEEGRELLAERQAKAEEHRKTMEYLQSL